ncbi:Uncharacterised protein [Vibrio cholerae]|uniref:Uncharacterized protein n=1 Tax=Vibrio cholerae TaxID=666 RepID=A0A655YQ65_VIBCL|nr:Uncharacterised protein [Vibrio cholerae]
MPPPTKAAIELEWCGARKGRNFQLCWLISCCVREAIEAVSIASSSLISGSKSHSREASMVLPVPGGPRNNRL